MTVSHWPRRDHHTLAPPPMIQPRFWQRVALGWRVPISHVRRKAFYVATPLGFEPRITPPKGAVLPLHYGVSRFASLDRRFWIKAQFAKSQPVEASMHSRVNRPFCRAMLISSASPPKLASGKGLLDPPHTRGLLI